jgi:hypothetical protein
MLLNGNHTISYKMSLTPTSWAQKNINGSEREFTHDKCLGDTLTLISGSGTPINYLTDGDATTLTSFTSNSAELV